MEVNKVRNSPAVIEKLKPHGLEPLSLTPAEFDKMIGRDIETHLAIVKKAGLTSN